MDSRVGLSGIACSSVSHTVCFILVTGNLVQKNCFMGTFGMSSTFSVWWLIQYIACTHILRGRDGRLPGNGGGGFGPPGGGGGGGPAPPGGSGGGSGGGAPPPEVSGGGGGGGGEGEGTVVTESIEDDGAGLSSSLMVTCAGVDVGHTLLLILKYSFTISSICLPYSVIKLSR